MGVVGDDDASNLVYLGLYALQHRGQEACGIVCSDFSSESKNGFSEHKSFGLVADVFTREIIESLRGNVAIGHVRYSTQGGRRQQNIQPFSFRLPNIGQVSVAHNGNLTNAGILRSDLENKGSVFSSTSDTEVFVHLLARSRGATILERLRETLGKVRGAYSLVLMAQGRVYAVRDPYGFRPLVIGRKAKAYFAASETCALDLLDAQFIGEVSPGEIVELTVGGIDRHRWIAEAETYSAFCAFEPIYFARPDSIVFGNEIYSLRKGMGTQLAKESPQEDADVVIAIPDSGVPMALGYSEASGIPLELGLVRNHYVGRTFIEPSQSIRDFGVKLKLNAVGSTLKGKNVVVIDDSIVRGTTSVKIIRMLRMAGADRIHFKIGSPPITHSCYYGVDTPERSRLLAAQKNVEAIRKFVGADSLAFLSHDGLRIALRQGKRNNFCMSCFDGRYPEEIFKPIDPQPTDLDGPGLRSVDMGT